MINNTKTRVWPDGDAQAIWDDLYSRFVPKTALSRAQIRVELDNLKLERGEDPRVLYDKIEIIQAKMTERQFYFDEEEYISAVIKALPGEYDHSLVNATASLGNKAMTLEKLKGVIIELYEITTTLRKQTGKVKRFKEGEVSLSSTSGNKSFTGNCFKCGQTGHKASNCPNKNRNGGNNFYKEEIYRKVQFVWQNWTQSCRLLGK